MMDTAYWNRRGVPSAGGMARALLLGWCIVCFATAVESAQPWEPADAAHAPCRDPQRWNIGWKTAIPEDQAPLRDLYLEGRCNLDEGNWEPAARIFREGLALHPQLRPWWRLWLLSALLPQYKTTQAEVVLAALLADNPPQPVIDALRELLELHTTSPLPGRTAGYHRLIGTYLAGVTPGPQDHGLLTRQWESGQALGISAPQQKLLLHLWQTPRNRPEALAWAGELKLSRAKGMPPPPGEALVRRSRRLRSLRLHEQNVNELAVADLSRASQEQARRLGRYYVLGLLRLRRYREAEHGVESPGLRRRFAWSEEERVSLATRIALARRNMKKAQRLAARLEQINPQAHALPEFYLRFARHYGRRGDAGGLTTWSRRLVVAFPRHAQTGEAYWMMMWMHFRKGAYRDALALGEEAIAAGEVLSHGEQARIHYWKVRSLAALGRGQEEQAARRVLLERFPSSYYGLVVSTNEQENGAPEREPRMDAQPRALRASSPRIASAWSQAHLQPALFLYSVAEFDQARAALNWAIGKPLPREAARDLADLSRYYNQYNLLQRIMANYYLSDLRMQPRRTRVPWLDAYPQAYWNLVFSHAKSAGINPYFALAIMREESHFNPKVESGAGALGLMQLMPPTARQIARRKRIPFVAENLFTPEGNIPLGVAYLGRMVKQFKGDLIHAAAAYNAGPGSVRRWLKTMGRLPRDVFVESIPFAETQTYVRRVYGSYLIYRTLYR